jgi:hypothetical protein
MKLPRHQAAGKAVVKSTSPSSRDLCSLTLALKLVYCTVNFAVDCSVPTPLNHSILPPPSKNHQIHPAAYLPRDFCKPAIHELNKATKPCPPPPLWNKTSQPPCRRAKSRTRLFLLRIAMVCFLEKQHEPFTSPPIQS